MRIDHPSDRHIPQLRQLWQEAFGDTEAFLDLFFGIAYSPARCRCVLEGDAVAAVLYWFDCHMEDRKLAYIYAVATRKAFRGRGLCRRLMADTHALLAQQGYDTALLVPQSGSLRTMYGNMGYQNRGGLNCFSCGAAAGGLTVNTLSPEEYAAERRKRLPPASVIQEGENLDFLAAQLQFFAGDTFLLAAFSENDMLHGVELLGDAEAAPGILAALGFSRGRFRTPGDQIPFAMCHPLTENGATPDYFGFAFD